MKDSIFLNPVFKSMIWGGTKLKTEFGFQISDNHTGESWLISAHKNGDCTVKNGEFEGKTLSWLWNNHRELFGNINTKEFPLLVKIIDAKEDLSIQVHPNDDYAKENENGSYGKTECWYILDCNENAEIILGHNAKNKDELIYMINNAKWKDLVKTRKIRKGDFLQINPGTLHAIKKGTLVLEIQQNSDITYRVYDYDRLDNGKKRELHLNKCLDVIACPHNYNITEMKQLQRDSCEVIELIICDTYVVKKVIVYGKQYFVRENTFSIVCVVEGDGYIDNQKIKKGDCFIIPQGSEPYILEGDMQLIVSGVGMKMQ